MNYKKFIESLQPNLVNDDIGHLHTSCIKLFADESRGPVERAEIAIPPWSLQLRQRDGS